MKLLFERMLESECTQLHQRGITPRLDLISKQVTDLASHAEIRICLASWLKMNRHDSAHKLRSAGFSPDVVNAFSKPIEKTSI